MESGQKDPSGGEAVVAVILYLGIFVRCAQTEKRRKLIWISFEKCSYGGCDYTITKILKRMTVTLKCRHGRWCSIYPNDAPDL